jgi:hypothetical protein
MAAQPPPATANFSEGTPPDELMPPESRSAAFASGMQGTPGDTATLPQVLQFGGQQ